MSVRLKDIMVTDVKTIEADRSVSEAANLMSMHNIGCLIVLHEGKPVGIVTERDILKKIVAPCRDPRTTKVKEIMSKPLITGEPNMDIEYAAEFMIRRDIKRLPIVEDGKVIGIVTFTDLVRIQPRIVDALEGMLTSLMISKRFEKILRKRVMKT